MGVHITLEIATATIDPSAWAACYDETLTFLTRCPHGILGLRKRKIDSGVRWVYTRALERKVSTAAKRHWVVSGDARSKTFAETFELYRDLDRYGGGPPTGPEAGAPMEAIDILAGYRPGDTSDYGPGISTVFEEKTQGQGYHIPLLATAMLVEAAFPRAALAGGNIDLAQAHRAQALIREVLGREVAVPVRVDGPRLLTRLHAAAVARVTTDSDNGQPVSPDTGPAPDTAPDTRILDVMRRFRNIFIGADDDGDAALLAGFGPATYARWFAHCLKHDGLKAGTLGTNRRFTTWLNLGLPARDLIRCACLDEAGPRFDPLAVAKTIANTGVTVPPDDPADLRGLWAEKYGCPDTVEDQFVSIMLDLYGAASRRLRAYVPAAEMIDAFSTQYPERSAEFGSIFERRTEEEEPGKLADLIAGLIRRAHQNRPPTPAPGGEAPEPGVADAAAGPMAPARIPRHHTMDELLCIGSLDELAEGELEMLTKFGQQLATRCKAFREALATHTNNPKPLRELQLLANNAAEERGIALTEDTWEHLDNPENTAELTLAVIMLSISEMSKSFWDFRFAILENPILRRTIAGIMIEAANQATAAGNGA